MIINRLLEEHRITCIGKSRHKRRRHNIVRQLFSNGVISIDYIKSKDNLANPLTKGLPRDQVNYLSSGMKLKSITKKSS